MSFVEIVVRVLGILLRECTYKGFLLAIFSLRRYSISLIFENKLRSSLVVPEKHPAIDHASYFMGRLVNLGLPCPSFKMNLTSSM
jgi:hypothetical protein